MKPSEVFEELALTLPAGLSVYIHGGVGIGKSTVVRDFAHSQAIPEERDENDNVVTPAQPFGFIDLRASQLDPVDARGIPVADHDNRETRWYPPNFLPNTDRHPERGIVFLDELNKASQDTQNALYQFILDRRVGDYVVPEGWWIVAAGNRQVDGSFVQPLARALKNRFVHFEMESNHADFIRYATIKGFHEKVIAFLRDRPDLLNEEEATTKDEKGKRKKLDSLKTVNAFATPRSWEFASKILFQADKSKRPVTSLYALLDGTVGAPATEFISWCSVYGSIPDFDEILADPSRFRCPDNSSALYAICTGLSQRCTVDNFENIYHILNEIPREYKTFTVGDCLMRVPEIKRLPSYRKWAMENVKYT